MYIYTVHTIHIQTYHVYINIYSTPMRAKNLLQLSVKVQAQSSGFTNQELDMPNMKIKSDTIGVLLLFSFLIVQKKKISSLLFEDIPNSKNISICNQKCSSCFLQKHRVKYLRPNNYVFVELNIKLVVPYITLRKKL